MTKTFKYLLSGTALFFAGAIIFTSHATIQLESKPEIQEEDTLIEDTLSNVKAVGPQFNLKPDPNFPPADLNQAEGMQLRQPSNLRSEVDYDPVTKQYIFTNKIGSLDYRRPSSMSMKDFQKYEMKRTVHDYWKSQANGGKSSTQRGFRPSFNIGGEAFDKIFGSSTINIVPQGQAELIFGVSINTSENPNIDENLRTTTSFDFQEKIQMNVSGSIGERLKLGINYNTEASFDFENKTKLEYSGDEDDIVKKVEAGDVTLPLPGTLITGSQSLFGIKTEMQFGKLNVTTVLSQQKGQTQVINVQGGAQVTEFEITADDYEVNKHFFLSHTFKDNYNKAHDLLPKITANIVIKKIEVWITNKKGKYEDARDIVAFIDLAETKKTNLSNQTINIFNSQFPDNQANDLFNKVKGFVHNGTIDKNISGLSITDQEYEKPEAARKLSDNEFSYDPYLGYISLNTSLNADEIVAVAYQYEANGKVFNVGELSSDNPTKQPLVLKLIKGKNLSPRQKTWGLMMKNIYSLGAFELSNEDFYLNILYTDDRNGTDVNYLPENNDKLGKANLLQLFNLDKVNSQMQNHPDGVFDFIDGVTIDKKYGRVIFPILEPFGKGIDSILTKNQISQGTIKRYTYYELYDSTQTKARLVAEKNKFKLKGTYKSASSSEIYLNAMNVPQGSVKVTSGGLPLTENQDYVVDYALGTVKIINSGIMSSGQPIKVSLESNSMFNIQTKTLVGTHMDYKFSDDFNIGTTIMHLNERPLTKKVNIGDEPISNTIWGLNTTYRTNSQFLTSLVDKIPLIDTKEPSNITLTGEFAQLIPGTSSAIGKNGVAYIDDFEGSESIFDLKSLAGWSLASTPSSTFGTDAKLTDDLRYGYNRAKLSWYTIDRVFFLENSLTPDAVRNHNDWKTSPYSRQVFERELYPNRQSPNNTPTDLQIFNLTYYPTLRGPYNFDPSLNNDGTLKNPEKRWGGLMKGIQQSNFEAANIEYLEFWLMDPFADDDNNTGGSLYFNLGEVSEDILKDGKKSFEQGLPTNENPSETVNTAWGVVSTNRAMEASFTNGTGDRELQDVGLDGLDDISEKERDTAYLNAIKNNPALNDIEKDPAADNFKHYLSDFSDTVDIIGRYMDYNGVDKNSQEATSGNPRQNYQSPDMEDINGDNTMDNQESYFEYKVDLKRNSFNKGENYIVDSRKTTIKTSLGTKEVMWYQFKIPVQEYTGKYGDIEDFTSIRFLRMYLTGFNKQTTLRFATLELIRGEWRKYLGSLIQGGESLSDQPTVSGFDIQAVNIEENPNYVLPPGIDRVIDPSQTQLRELNEQSMVLKVSNLADGDARAAFKTSHLDMRQYNKLKMEVHCEKLGDLPLSDGDVTVFIRIGSDFKSNYYEYEVPMKVTQSGINKDPKVVWDEKNRFDINLDMLQRLKQARNDSSVPFQNVYRMADGNNTMSITGNPTLSNIKAIMIGVRNPIGKGSKDKLPKSAEIWVNELRLTDFSDKGGWAANARAQIKLADFANIRVSGSTMLPGFGSIEKKVNDREKEETNQYDVSTDVELGKFFPEKAQVHIPFYASYSETQIKPQYNPLDPDIPLQAAIDNANANKDKKQTNYKSADEIKQSAIDQTIRRSINFTNVKVNKASKRPQFYDPANFSVSYGYNDQKSHNHSTLYNNLDHYEGSFNYIYNNRPKNISPFQKVSFLNYKPFRLIKDFNFYYAPTSIAFRTSMVRNYREMQLKNLTDTSIKIAPTVEKDFTWNRNYNVKYDLSRSLKIDFTATNIAAIDEWDKTMTDDESMIMKRNGKFNAWEQIKKGGRTTNYNQQINVDYTVPINKIPLLDWTSLMTRYGANYEWEYQPLAFDKDNKPHQLGNNISNSRTIQINPNFTLSTIYNKIGFLKDLRGDVRGGKGGKEKQKEMRTVKFEKSYFSLKAGVPKSISHKLGTEDVTIKVTDSKRNDVKGKLDVISSNRITFTPDSDANNVNVVVEGKVEAGMNPLVFISRNTARILTGLKSISISYNITDATALPGYLNKSTFLGSVRSNGYIAPGIPFILGSQNNSELENMYNRGWLTKDDAFIGNLQKTNSVTLNLRANYEPFNGLRVDITANHSKSRNSNSTMSYKVISLQNEPKYFNDPTFSGTFSMTVIAIGSFESLKKSNNFSSSAFEHFKNSTVYFAQLLTKNLGNPKDSTGYKENSQQVLIPAFLAIYGGYGNQGAPLDLFPSYKYMRPNWRVNYDGLSELAFVKEYFQSITLSHTYSSTYNIGSYITNAAYNPSLSGYDMVRNELGLFVPQFDVASVTLNEQFSPFLGIDMTWQNNLTTRIEFKKSRIVSLGLTNNSISDSHSKEYVFGVGYRFPDMPLSMITFGASASPIKSDLNVRADLSIRDDVTVLRSLVQSTQQPTAGDNNMSLSLSADYALSDRLNVRLFFDRLFKQPYLTSSYTTIDTKFGFSVRFTLAQ